MTDTLTEQEFLITYADKTTKNEWLLQCIKTNRFELFQKVLVYPEPITYLGNDVILLALDHAETKYVQELIRLNRWRVLTRAIYNSKYAKFDELFPDITQEELENMGVCEGICYLLETRPNLQVTENMMLNCVDGYQDYLERFLKYGGSRFGAVLYTRSNLHTAKILYENGIPFDLNLRYHRNFVKEYLEKIQAKDPLNIIKNMVPTDSTAIINDDMDELIVLLNKADEEKKRELLFFAILTQKSDAIREIAKHISLYGCDALTFASKLGLKGSIQTILDCTVREEEENDEATKQMRVN